LEIARNDGFIVVEWTKVLRDHINKLGLTYNFPTVREIVRQEGLQFFPHKVMRCLLEQYIEMGGNCRGFVVAGSQSMREMIYLAGFFDRKLTKIIQICASDNERLRRYNIRENQVVSMKNFLHHDQMRMFWDLRHDLPGASVEESVHTVLNDAINPIEFKRRIREVLSK
jgi:hypothetical protein